MSKLSTIRSNSCNLSTFVLTQMGTSKGLKVGQSVYALGNPQGLSRTLTAGVVSGLNRAVPSPVNTLTYGAIQVCVPCRTIQQQILLTSSAGFVQAAANSCGSDTILPLLQ